MKINIINGASKRALDKAFQLVSVYIKQIFFHSAYLIWRRRSCILFTSTTQCYVKWEKNGRELKCFVVFLTSSLETQLKCCLTLKKRTFFVESFSAPCAAFQRLAGCCCFNAAQHTEKSDQFSFSSHHSVHNSINCLHPDKFIPCRLSFFTLKWFFIVWNFMSQFSLEIYDVMSWCCVKSNQWHEPLNV